MNNNQTGTCLEEHVAMATEFHSDGRLCDEWLADLECARLSDAECTLTKRMVLRDQILHLRKTDRGQLLRLQKALSLARPPKRRIKRERGRRTAVRALCEPLLSESAARLCVQVSQRSVRQLASS